MGRSIRERGVYFPLIFLWLFLFLMADSFAQTAENITIATYYPAPYGAYSELTTTGMTLLATEGSNVGIGTTNPSASALLHVYRNSGIDSAQVVIQNEGGRAAELEITSDTGQWDLRAPGSLNANSGKFIIQQVTLSSNIPRVVISAADGNVGIGTTNPMVKATGPVIDVQDVWLRDANSGLGRWASSGRRWITITGCNNVPITGCPSGWIQYGGIRSSGTCDENGDDRRFTREVIACYQE